MAKFCTNCGHQNETPNARFCEACGQPLEQNEQNNDYEFDFSSQSQQSSQQPSSQPYYADAQPQQDVFATAPVSGPSIEQTKKINKAKKDMNGWSIAVLVLVIIRMCVMFSTIDDLETIDSMVPQLPYELASMFSSYVTVGYIEIVVLLGLLATSIVLTIFATKTIKIKDPSNTDIFAHAKKCQISAIVAMVLCIIYLVCEIAIVAISFDIEASTGEEVLNMGTIIGAIGGEVLLIAGTAICANCARKIVKSKDLY